MIESIYDNYFRRFRIKALKTLPPEEAGIFKHHFDNWEKSLSWEAKAKVGSDFKSMTIEQFPGTVLFMLEGFKHKMREDTLKLAAEADKEFEDGSLGGAINSSSGERGCDSSIPTNSDSGN
jgi:hypothetical protein